MTKEREGLFFKQVQAESRTYFFDVRESMDGMKCLVIGEFRHATGEAHDRHRVLVFEEHLLAFNEGLKEAVRFITGRDKPKAYNVEHIRREHPRAYEKWTEEEDVRLAREYDQSKSDAIHTLAKAFGRQPGAIRSRLRKLDLL